jgi:uncharacterized protein DUF4287
MTLQKKLKKAVRARSQKTGESYTAARRQVLLARDKKAPAAEPVAVEPAPSKSASKPPFKGGVTEEASRQKTGHGLDHWFAVLDAFGAMGKGHTATAAYLYDEHGVPGWYAQGIALAYERARGLRAPNQTCDGTFQVSVSKTVPVDVAEVIAALRSAERRARWLQGADAALVQALDAAFLGPKPREVKTKGDSYAWLRFRWDGSTVEIRITGKANGRTSVVADNIDLAGTEQVEQRRAQWRVALEGLLRHLGG